MNGKRYLLDTNAIIQLLLGNQALLKLVNDADFVATSVADSKLLNIADIHAHEYPLV